MKIKELKAILNKRNDIDDAEVIISVDDGQVDALYDIGSISVVPSLSGTFVTIGGYRTDEEDADACERDSLGNDWW